MEGATHSAAGRRETHVGNAIDAEGTMYSGELAEYWID